MIAAFGTLAFIGTLWLLAVLAATILGESGAKILAALKGQPAPVQTATIRIKYRQRGARPVRARTVRATPRLRAAA